MALSAQTFVELDANLARRVQAASRAINDNQFGLIPFTEFDNRGGFVRNKLEIERLVCMALLPSGKIRHIFIKPLMDAEITCHLCYPETDRRRIVSQTLQSKSQFMPDFICYNLVLRILLYISDLLTLLSVINLSQILTIIADPSRFAAIRGQI